MLCHANIICHPPNSEAFFRKDSRAVFNATSPCCPLKGADGYSLLLVALACHWGDTASYKVMMLWIHKSMHIRLIQCIRPAAVDMQVAQAKQQRLQNPRGLASLVV